MNETDNAYWQHMCDDIRNYRKGLVTREELTRNYPDLLIKNGWRKWEEIEDAIEIIIPAQCPLRYKALLISLSKYEPFDKNLITRTEMVFDYDTTWDILPQKGKLKDICKEKRAVTFNAYDNRNSVKGGIRISYCIKEGSHGDEDGYDVGRDTWLVALLNFDGSWLKEWFIED